MGDAEQRIARDAGVLACNSESFTRALESLEIHIVVASLVFNSLLAAFFKYSARVSEYSVPKNVQTAPFVYENKLTAEQREMIFEKAISCFEAEALQEQAQAKRNALRPTPEDWRQYRCVTTHWTQTIEQCAQSQMDEADFLDVKRAVLYGSFPHGHAPRAA